MRSFVITNETEWSRWRSSWNSLVRSNPMQSIDWLSAWWRHFGASHQLHIVAAAEGDQIVGMVPCYEHETRLGKQLRLLGSGPVCSDYLGGTVTPHLAAEVYSSMNACMQEFVQRREIEALHFEGVSHASSWTPQLKAFANETGYSIRVQPMVNCWSLSLPGSWAELQQSQRTRSVYRKAKKCFGRIQSGEIKVRHLTQQSDLEEGMQQLVRLHQARRESMGDHGCFSDPRFEPFLREAIGSMLAEGAACFTLCEKNGVAIGVGLLLLGTDTVFMYQSGFDPAYSELEPGHLTIAGSLQFAIHHGFKNYDFLRGDESYKKYWGAKPQPLERIILAPPTLKAQTIEVVYRNLSWLRSCYDDLSGSGVKKILGEIRN